MMTPPLGPDQGPFLMLPDQGAMPPQEAQGQGPPVSAPVFLTVTIPDDEQQEIVSICQRFKQGAITHARDKKERMRRCYAYTRSQFFGDDLLPRLAAEGAEKDAQTGRPQLFVPVTRQQIKLVYSFLKLSLFPNDEDFFRVLAKSDIPISPQHAQRLGLEPPEPYVAMVEAVMAQGADPAIVPPPKPPSYIAFEKDLTEGLKYIFKNMRLTEQLGKALFDACWAGSMAAIPCARFPIYYEWGINPVTGEGEPIAVQGEPELVVDVWNPLYFYIDPHATDRANAKWGYFTTKKKQELLDGPYYINKNKLDGVSNKTVNDTNRGGQAGVMAISQFNELSNTFADVEDNVLFDLYYFPIMTLPSGKQYRNMLFAIAGEKVLVEARPNLMPKGLPPAVFSTWLDDKDSPYGTGPAEDASELQRSINIIFNNIVENMARNGNQWAVSPATDTSQFHGVAGGVVVTENPTHDIVSLSSSMGHVASLMELISSMKSELELVVGAQNTHTGVSDSIAKSATEFRVRQENSIGIAREVVEHIASDFLKPVLYRLMLLASELIKEPINVRIDDNLYGSRFAKVDFSLLATGQYDIELVSVNSSQSKEAQIGWLTQAIQYLGSNPMALSILEPLIVKTATLSGIKDAQSLLSEVKERMAQLANTQPAAGTGEPGGDSAGQPGVENSAEAVA